MKTNLLVNFAYADYEEVGKGGRVSIMVALALFFQGRRRHDSAEAIYKQLLDCKEVDPTLVG